MEQEEAIDLGRLFHVMLERKKIIGGIMAGCTTLAVATAFLLPEKYESTTLVQTRAAAKAGGGAAALLGFGGASAVEMSYIELMKSRSVLDPIMETLDWPEEEKENLTAAGFAKDVLDIQNTKATNLITVTAEGRTPEEAQQISQSVVDNFLLLMTDMNRQEQSFLVRFLTERIEEARKDSDEAAQALEDFGRKTQVYGPTEQAQAQIEQMMALDKTLANLKVERESTQARLAQASEHLEKQNANSKAYNVADNENILNIRDSMVRKEVELVGLEQKYQEKHPAVITAREELKKLQEKLASEVANAVDAGTVTMNPLQAELLKEKTLAQVSLAVTEASEQALREWQEKAEADMGQLSEDILAYTKLSRDAQMKNEIYVNLVKNCEEAKIQQTMESMDIQIVDRADLPKKPASPKKLLITAIGFVLGCMISFGYSLIAYHKDTP